jgi:fluoride exporter
MISVILVAFGGMVGAISRYMVQRAMPTNIFPFATLTVNLAGSFLLGWITGKGIEGNLYLLAAVGFMGAFTTFSTLNVDLVKLFISNDRKIAYIYLITTYAGGLLSCFAGLISGRMGD